MNKSYIWEFPKIQSISKRKDTKTIWSHFSTHLWQGKAFSMWSCLSSFFFRKKSASKVCSSGSAARYLHWSKSFSEVTIEYLGKISFDSKILYQHTFSYNGWPSKPFLPKRVGWLCPVRSAIKRTSLQDLNSFFIMFYYIISNTYQKIRGLFCPFIYLDFHTVWQWVTLCHAKWAWMYFL